MKTLSCRTIVLAAVAACTPCFAADAADPRLREVGYDPQAVVTVPVKRGVVTLVVLGGDEMIMEVASGLGGYCIKPDAAWCVTAQAGGRHLFVKPKSAAAGANTVAVVTDRRTHSFRFVVLPDGDSRQAVYRLTVKPPAPPAPVARAIVAAGGVPETTPERVVAPVVQEAELAERLKAPPRVVNSAYSLAEGKASADIVPTLVFDDGRFTYLRLPGNRELPAVFAVLADGSETLTNTRMEGDLLVVDRVSRRLTLRAGEAVVGIWNDAFDIDGVPPEGGTTAPGVRRTLKSDTGIAPQPVPQPEEPRDE